MYFKDLLPIFFIQYKKQNHFIENLTFCIEYFNINALLRN